MRVGSIVAAWLAFVYGCGGQESSSPEKPTDLPTASADASLASEVDGDDTGLHGGPGSSSPSTVSAAPPPLPAGSPCDVLADAICSNEAAICCGDRGMPMDVGACRARVERDCAALKQQVIDGTRRYDPSHLGECLEGWGAINRACRIAKVTVLETWVRCAMMFPAIKPRDSGAACVEDADCMVYPGELGRCIDDSCLRVSMPLRSASWNSRGHTALNPCYPGEASCAGSAAGGMARRCRRALSLGAECGTSIDGCCAVGTQCSQWGMGETRGTCVPAANVGESCMPAWPETCATYWCSAEGVCEDRSFEDPLVFDTYVASPALCFGMGSYGLVR